MVIVSQKHNIFYATRLTFIHTNILCFVNHKVGFTLSVKKLFNYNSFMFKVVIHTYY